MLQFSLWRKRETTNMPQVENKKYAYTKAGMKKAKVAAKKKGVKVQYKKKY